MEDAGIETGYGQRPVVFRVSAYIAGWWGGGTLTVAPGVIAFEASRATRALSGASRVVHRERTVMLVTARFLPPWCNVGLLLSGDGSAAVAIVSIWRRKGLRVALEQAGFEVRAVATRLSVRGIGGVPVTDRLREGTTRRRRATLALVNLVGGAGAVLLVWHYPALVVLVCAGVATMCFALLRNLP